MILSTFTYIFRILNKRKKKIAQSSGRAVDLCREVGEGPGIILSQLALLRTVPGHYPLTCTHEPPCSIFLFFLLQTLKAPVTWLELGKGLS